MLLYTCIACRRGDHDHCAGRQPPPPGVFGGRECDCDGNCAKRPLEADPQLTAIFDAIDKAQGKP